MTYLCVLLLRNFEFGICFLELFVDTVKVILQVGTLFLQIVQVLLGLWQTEGNIMLEKTERTMTGIFILLFLPLLSLTLLLSPPTSITHTHHIIHTYTCTHTHTLRTIL